MPKRSKDQILVDEMKIISELQKNCNSNYDTIAKNCGFSRQKTLRMIKQMEKDRKIWGRSAVFDNEKQNLEKFILFVKRTEIRHNPKDIDEIVEKLLASTKEELGITMISSYRLHGEYDWLMLFTARDIIHAKKFADAIVQKFPGRQSIHISQIIFTVRENYIQNPDIGVMKDFI